MLNLFSYLLTYCKCYKLIQRFRVTGLLTGQNTTGFVVQILELTCNLAVLPKNTRVARSLLFLTTVRGPVGPGTLEGVKHGQLTLNGLKNDKKSVLNKLIYKFMFCASLLTLQDQ